MRVKYHRALTRRIVGCVICCACGRRRTAYKTPVSGLRAWPHGPRPKLVEGYGVGGGCAGSWKEGAIMGPATLRRDA